MKKIFQTKFGNHKSNCLAAVLCSIIGCKIETTFKFDATWQEPNEFSDEVARKATYDFLKSRGFAMLSYQYNDIMARNIAKSFSEIPIIMVGKSPQGNWNHTVIYKSGQMIHDPHPDGKGILGFEFICLVVKI